MNAEDRREVRDRISNASPRVLRGALLAVLDADAKAQKDHADDPADVALGFFADGTDSAAACCYVAVLGREPAEATS